MQTSQTIHGSSFFKVKICCLRLDDTRLKFRGNQYKSVQLPHKYESLSSCVCICVYLIQGVYLLMRCSVRSVTPGQELKIKLWSLMQFWSKVSTAASVTCYSENGQRSHLNLQVRLCNVTFLHRAKLWRWIWRFWKFLSQNLKPTACSPVRFSEMRHLSCDVITVRLCALTFGTCPMLRCWRPGHI